MIARTTLTFNPGWDDQARPLDSFQDIRDLQRALKAAGVSFISEAPETGSGPASYVVTDPDGTPILVDQHV